MTRLRTLFRAYRLDVTILGGIGLLAYGLGQYSAPWAPIVVGLATSPPSASALADGDLRQGSRPGARPGTGHPGVRCPHPLSTGRRSMRPARADPARPELLLADPMHTEPGILTYSKRLAAEAAPSGG